MIKKKCPICEVDGDNTLVYKENLPSNQDKINYSARKDPDNYHYEMVRCNKCSLLFASSIYDQNKIDHLYTISDFDYNDELIGLKKSYGSCLYELDKKVINKNRILDIGCANGFVLEKAKEFGWKEVYGVELSTIAINNAEATIKNNISNKSFETVEYKDNFFDVIFFAMIIEHFVDVNQFLSKVYAKLAPGGYLIGITHDEQHFLSRFLKNKHPIINDEHVSVFNINSLSKILKKHNFKIEKIKSLRNFYTLKYWIKMLPLNYYISKILLYSLRILRLENINIGIRAGNIYCIAKK